MNQHNPPLTPDEVETGRRNLIAKLRYEYADGRPPEITLDAETVRDLVALLEALEPTPVAERFDVGANSMVNGQPGWSEPVVVDRAAAGMRNILGVTRSVYKSDGAMFAVHHLATVSAAAESASGWTDREALCGAKLVQLYDEQWDVKVCVRCTRLAEQGAAERPTLDHDEIQDAIYKAMASEVTWAECRSAADAVLAALYPKATEGES